MEKFELLLHLSAKWLGKEQNNNLIHFPFINPSVYRCISGEYLYGSTG
jgi:hypothetical protein